MIDWARLTPAVKRAALTAKASFPAHHDVSDVEQDIWLWVMEKKAFVLEVLTRENGESGLVNIMTKVGLDSLKTEDAQTYGYDEQDRFFYSEDLIKKILEVVFRYEDWQSFASSMDAMPRGRKDHALSGDNLASYADVKSAAEKLPEELYNIVVWRYKYHLSYAAIGREAGIPKDRARRLSDKAVSALQKSLGEMGLAALRGGYSGRTADSVTRGKVSTANAQYIVERDYEG